MESSQKRNNRSVHALYLNIIAILISLCTVLAWQYKDQKQRAEKSEVIIKEVYIERDNVKQDLVQLQEDFSNLKTNDARVQKELEEKKAYIAELLEQAEKHK